MFSEQKTSISVDSPLHTENTACTERISLWVWYYIFMIFVNLRRYNQAHEHPRVENISILIQVFSLTGWQCITMRKRRLFGVFLEFETSGGIKQCTEEANKMERWRAVGRTTEKTCNEMIIAEKNTRHVLKRRTTGKTGCKRIKNAEAGTPQRTLKDGVWVLFHSPLTQRAYVVHQTLGRFQAPSGIINGDYITTLCV